jgi:hypothetical protein
MRPRARTEMFNFSFLDILATVLGVLLFILLFAILNQSELHKQSEEFERSHLLGKASETLEEGRAEGEKAQDLRAEIEGITPKIESLEKLHKSINEDIEELKEQCESREENIAALEKERERKKGMGMKLPNASGGGRGEPFHIDCTKDGLILLGTNLEEGRDSRKRCSSGDIEKADGPFGKLLKDISSGRRSKDTVLVLWIRPDGVESGRLAMDAARKAEVRMGYEPADQQWSF